MSMVHMYYGNGAGKTTAALGSALRASGAGMKVLYTRFFKGDDASEIISLRKLDNVSCLFPSANYSLGDDIEGRRVDLSESYNGFLKELDENCKAYDLVILDEILLAYALGLIDKSALIKLIGENKANTEFIMTGVAYDKELADMSDYVSNVVCEKHPYNRGTSARKGIEF